MTVVTDNVLITGGSTSANNIISILDDSTGTMTLSSFTGIPGGFEDILSSVFDRSGNIYCILASLIRAQVGRSTVFIA
jgi:hypothetical protein